jgi:hypothetical protein
VPVNLAEHRIFRRKHVLEGLTSEYYIAALQPPLLRERRSRSGSYFRAHRMWRRVAFAGNRPAGPDFSGPSRPASGTAVRVARPLGVDPPGKSRRQRRAQEASDLRVLDAGLRCRSRRSGLPAVHDPLHRDEQDHQSAAAAGPGLDHRVLSHCRTLRARKVLLRDQEVRVVKQLLRDAGRRLLRRHPAPRRPRPGGGPARARRSCRVNIASQGGRDIDARHPPRWSGTP